MATVVQSIIEPDRDAIKAHLEMLFAPVREEYPRGLIELRYGDHFQSSYFNLREEGVAEAASFAANRNEEGCNVYVGVNPRRPTTNRKSGAFDDDVEISVWQFADLDDEESVLRVGKRLKALPPYFTVTTGTEPHRRPHFYWQMDEAVRNLGPWRDRQRGIAQSLESDRSVINPSRIMRLAGTVNFPPPHKLQKGYRVERTSIKTQFSDEREPVSPEQISQAYPLRAELAQSDYSPTSDSTTLSAMAPQSKTRALISAALSGDHWHDSVRDLTARLARLGRTDAEILLMADGLTLPGFTVEQTRADLRKFIVGARSKYGIAHPTEEQEEAAVDDGASVFTLLDMDELEALPPPTWLVHEMVADHGLTVIYGDPGAGKSFIALDMALRLAFGLDWHGVASKPVGVLYIAGEGARGLGKRIKGWRREHALEGVEAPFLLLPVAVQLLDANERAKLLRTIDAAVERAGFSIGLTVIDTVSRAIAGQDENGQEAMSTFVGACSDIQNFTSGAVIGVHHSGKDKDKGMRGSTVLLGGCDASLRITKDDQTVTIKTEKQKDAEEAEPIYMTLKKVSWAQGLGEEQSTLVPYKREAPLIDERELSMSQINRIFDAIERAWIDEVPLTPFEHSRRTGRFAADIIAKDYDISVRKAAGYLKAWQENGVLVTEERAKGKAKGLRVVRRLEE